MSSAEADAFLRETRIAKLAYLDASGAPTIVPVWFAWDGAVARVFTSRRSRKIARITADPRVALSVEERLGVPERWVTIEGRANMVEAGTIALLTGLANRYYAPERAAEAIASWTAQAALWVTIAITPDRIRSSA